MVTELGCHNYIQFLYRVHGKCMYSGLKYLCNDINVMNMLKCLPTGDGFKYIDLYVEYEYQRAVECCNILEVVQLLTNVLVEKNCNEISLDELHMDVSV